MGVVCQIHHLIMPVPQRKHIQYRGAMIPLPSQVLQEAPRPTNDGYRTPTIEDSTHPAHETHHPWAGRPRHNTSNLFQDHPHHERGHVRSSTLPSHWAISRTLAGRSEESAHHSQNKPMVLSWRKRVKHVTWAFFTLTMATGGIANVLSRGRHTTHLPNIDSKLT